MHLCASVSVRAGVHVCVCVCLCVCFRLTCVLTWGVLYFISQAFADRDVPSSDRAVLFDKTSFQWYLYPLLKRPYWLVRDDNPVDLAVTIFVCIPSSSSCFVIHFLSTRVCASLRFD